MPRVGDSLYRDKRFWAALLLGPLLCYLGFLLLGGGAVTGLPLAEWKLLLWLVLLYPVIEEWLFRGLLQGGLLRLRWARPALLGVTRANVLTSLLFAAAHILAQSSGWAALVLFPSLLFGWFRDRYDSVLPGTLLHIAYNLAFFTIFGTGG